MDSDQSFPTMMIKHHEDAVEMAERIISTQEAELEQMQIMLSS